MFLLHFFHEYPNKITGSYIKNMDIKKIGFHGNLIHMTGFKCFSAFQVTFEQF